MNHMEMCQSPKYINYIIRITTRDRLFADDERDKSVCAKKTND